MMRRKNCNGRSHDKLSCSDERRRVRAASRTAVIIRNGSAEWPPDDRLRPMIQYSRSSRCMRRSRRRTGCPPSRACTSYRFRSTNPCISRCGSSVRNDSSEHADAEIDGLRQRQLLPLPQQRLLRAQRLGAAFEQRLHRVLDRGIEPALRRDHVDQPPGQRRRRVDILRRHHQPAGAAPADQPRQQRGVDHRGDADADFRHAELRIMRGDPEIAGGGDFEAAAEAPAGHAARSRAPGTGARPRRDRAGALMKASADFWSSFAISLMSAPPIMLFSLWPASTTTRMSAVAGEFLKPSRTPSVTAEPRMLSEPALQIVRRTTPRAVAVDAAVGIEHFHRRSRSRDMQGRSGHFPEKATACQGAGSRQLPWRSRLT